LNLGQLGSAHADIARIIPANEFGVLKLGSLSTAGAQSQHHIHGQGSSLSFFAQKLKTALHFSNL
jgi:hypothetical protein